MTVKELIVILNTLPSDATVTYTNDRFIVDEVIYDDYDNSILFAGTTSFIEDENENYDFDDSVDESNYDPYAGCDVYDCEPIDDWY